MHRNLAQLNYIAPVFRVTDITRSLAFYRDQLGFVVEFIYEDFYAGLRRDVCWIHLKSAPPPSRDQTEFEQQEHIDASISVQDAELLSASFAAKDVPFAVPLRRMPYGVEFYVRDPDGYILGFIQPAFEQDEVQHSSIDA